MNGNDRPIVAAESRFLSAATLSVVRTECCESFRTCGSRCSNCPNRPENREAVARYKEDAQRIRLGRRFTLVMPETVTAS